MDGELVVVVGDCVELVVDDVIGDTVDDDVVVGEYVDGKDGELEVVVVGNIVVGDCVVELVVGNVVVGDTVDDVVVGEYVG